MRGVYILISLIFVSDTNMGGHRRKKYIKNVSKPLINKILTQYSSNDAIVVNIFIYL